jgi:hypothetical protein
MILNRGDTLMHQLYLRHTALGRLFVASSVPAAQAQALDRRQTLNAQQKAFRETAATRQLATPVRRRPS